MAKSLKYLASFIAITFILVSFIDNKKSLPKTKEELGEILFNDPILSSDKTISCGSCHKADFAFSDTVAFSNGVNGNKATRNTPTAMNMLAREVFFFDGRAKTLEEQALVPIQNPAEMNLPIDSAVARLNNSKFYVDAFKKLYNTKPSKDNLSFTISTFERTLETGNSLYDESAKGKPELMSASAHNGRLLFIGKANCFDCHMGIDFTSDEFKNIGIYDGEKLMDKGRYEITKKESDLGKFKIPGLRNVAVTKPYMHNGMFSTLKQVVDYYNNPSQVIPNAINRDTSIHALNLTASEVDDLVAFLESLTDKRFTKK